MWAESARVRVANGDDQAAAIRGVTSVRAGAARLYDPALGAFYCEFLPEWSSSEVSGGKAYVFYMTHNGGADYDALYYDFPTGAWKFARKVGGSTYTASKTASVTRGTRVKLAARWTGVEAELDLPAYTISVFVDGVKGTDATAAAPTFTSPETFYRGHDNAFANHANGALRQLRIFPFAPYDDEIAPRARALDHDDAGRRRSLPAANLADTRPSRAAKHGSNAANPEVRWDAALFTPSGAGTYSVTVRAGERLRLVSTGTTSITVQNQQTKKYVTNAAAWQAGSSSVTVTSLWRSGLAVGWRPVLPRCYPRADRCS